MNNVDRERMEALLRQAVPPVDGDAAPERDLWPEVLRRMDAEPAARHRWPWFDWALAAGIVGMAVASPASIPVILYYL